jgi:hypothetical protein
MRILPWAVWVWVLASLPCDPVPVVAALRSEHTERRELALWVARVSANEGALKNRREAALVWQTTRNAAPTTLKRAGWLSRHSPRVHGSRPCPHGNCRWTPELQRGEEQPPSLILPWDQWLLRVLPLWHDTLAYVDWLVQGDLSSEDPCPVTPRTWGCERDRPRALSRGLYPIGCYGTVDDGFAYAKDCFRGGVWACDPRFEPEVQTQPTELWSSVAIR